MKKKRFLFGFIVGVVSAILGIVILRAGYISLMTSDTMERSITKRLNAPDILIADASCYKSFNHNLTYSDLEGLQHELDSISGKVIFLNIWTTSCIPCIAEMTSINQLYNRFKKLNVEFILISPEDPEVVKEFYHERNFDFPVYTVDRTHFKNSEYYSRSVPVTMVLSKERTLALKENRASNWNSDSVIELIESLN